MELLISLLLLAALAYGSWRSFQVFRQQIIVRDYQSGLLYKDGKFVKELSAGAYWINPRRSEIMVYDLRRTSFVIAGQEVMTGDSIGLKVSVVVSYSISDAKKMVNAVQSYYAELYALTQLALREELANYTADSLFEKSSSLSEALQKRLAPQAESLGLELYSVQLRDLMFANDLKRAFNDVLKARKEAEAAMERARGESASLRNLANAANLLDNNPNLLSLRLMQAIEASHGNSFALDSKLLERSAEDR